MSRLEKTHFARMSQEKTPWFRVQVEQQRKLQQSRNEDENIPTPLKPVPRIERAPESLLANLGLTRAISSVSIPPDSEKIMQSKKGYQNSSAQTIEYSSSGVQTISKEEIERYENSCGAVIDRIHEENYVSAEQLRRERIRNRNLEAVAYVEEVFREMDIDPYKLDQYQPSESEFRKLYDQKMYTNYVGSKIFCGVLSVHELEPIPHIIFLNMKRHDLPVGGYDHRVQQLLPHVWIVHTYRVK